MSERKRQKLVMGLTRVGSGQPSLVWAWKISPKNPKNFKFLFALGQKKSHWVGSKSTRVKGGSVSYLLQVKSHGTSLDRIDCLIHIVATKIIKN